MVVMRTTLTADIASDRESRDFAQNFVILLKGIVQNLSDEGRIWWICCDHTRLYLKGTLQRVCTVRCRLFGIFG